MFTIAFSGHRPDKLGGYNLDNYIYFYLRKELKKVLEKEKPDKCISGMALGWDTVAAEVCTELKIPWIAAVPFIGQEKIWPKQSQDHYHELLKKAIEVVIVSEGGYSPAKMQIRNEWMVDQATKMVACFDGSKGGTNNCLQYARKIGKEIIIIDPRLASADQK